MTRFCRTMHPDDQCADGTLGVPMILATKTAPLYRLAKRLNARGA